MHIEMSSVPVEIEDDVEAALQFFGKFLMGEVAEEVYIDLEMVDKDYDLVGECICDDAEEDDAPRFFTMFVREDYTDMFDLIKTLGHEMVHVKQFALEELTESTVVRKGSAGDVEVTSADLWHGAPWVPESDDDSYYDAPWEVEAFGLEEILADAFVNRDEI